LTTVNYHPGSGQMAGSDTVQRSTIFVGGTSSADEIYVLTDLKF